MSLCLDLNILEDNLKNPCCHLSKYLVPYFIAEGDFSVKLVEGQQEESVCMQP